MNRSQDLRRCTKMKPRFLVNISIPRLKIETCYQFCSFAAGNDITEA